MTSIGRIDAADMPGSMNGENDFSRPKTTQQPGIGCIEPVTSMPELSIIVPTRNESGNIEQLLCRIDPVARERSLEVIFVDDSTDNTPEIIADAGTSYSFPVRLIHRLPEQRAGGLGGAVLEGMRAARGQWIVVMDGDLQHPPELIPELRNEALLQSCDLVVASRYCPNGEAASFSPLRSLMSHGSTIAAKVLFPRRLRDVNDPMSGFFLVRRSSIDLNNLHPNGFKILLEIVGRTPNLRIGSVPFSFGERFAGQSKASLTEGIRFLHLLLTLRLGPSVARFGQFGLVGISGLIVNSLLLAFWTESIGLYYLLSLILATQGSSLWNFYLSEYWVFKGADLGGNRFRRGALFLLMNNVALLARAPIVFFLTSLLGVNYLYSNIISMVALLLLRFAVADSLIWKNPASQPVPSPATSISGITHEREVAA